MGGKGHGRGHAGAVGNADLLEAEFVKVAKSYSDSKSISYASWRDVGVPASTLKEAGISRGD